MHVPGGKKVKVKNVDDMVRTLEEESTRCRVAEAALRESEERFRTLFENVMDAIVVIDPSVRGKVVSANPAACRLFGYTQEEFVGLDKHALVDTSDPGLSTMLEHRKEGRQASAQLTYRRKDGSRFTGDVTSAFFRDSKGKRRVVAVVRDVTARKRTEEEIRRERDDLELRVRERTAELERKNRELSTLNQDLQEFAFVASHDLQEPLRKIQMFGEMLGKYGKGLNDQGIDCLNRMQDGAKRMGTLLSALLDYSRVTTRTEEFNVVDLSEVARDAISNVEYWIRRNRGQVLVEDLPIIDADRSQVVRLFQNLLSNGLKYQKPGEPPVVKVSGTKTGKTCRILFEDNGIGFEEKYLERIFKPFERLHGRSSAYTGVGMGLAICRKIVERHSGAITAKSTPGKGSTFIVTLPAKQRRNGDPVRPAAPLAGQGKGS
jgi:PAS domain S-box-containing protein